MMISRLAVIFVAALCFTINPAHAQETRQVLEKRLPLLLPAKAEWALVVVDMGTGKTIGEFGNSLQEQLVPASLMKLLTTGAVFDYVEQGGTMRQTVTVGRKAATRGKRRGKRLVQRVVEIRDQERLRGILRDMNVHSRNLTAQNMADFLGESRFGPPATRVKGTLAVCNFLNTFDLPAGEARIADGCGLMRENRVTARFMARYLYEIGKKPWFDRFRETLPRPGMEGTVRRIGYTDRRFRVKTGHLDDVFALAGYGVDANERGFSFAFIVNVRKGLAADRSRSRGELMRLLAQGTLQ